MDKADNGGNPLGEFLRARRELLSPEQCGVTAQGRRRVPGLRREEVALLAGVSAGYYCRLEQGRERHPSAQVLDAVGRALQLDDEARAYLTRLARPPHHRRRPPRAEKVNPHLLRLMDGWSGTPAFVLGHTLDVLARNRLAATLLAGFAQPDNVARMVFLDPAGSDFFRDWDRTAQSTVAALRKAADQHADDPRLVEVIGELSIRSVPFRRLWGRHEARGRIHATKAFRHQWVGDIDLHYQTFTVNAAPGQQLVVCQAEPASPSADALALLSTLAADVPGPAGLDVERSLRQ